MDKPKNARRPRNTVKAPSYFIKRLRESGWNVESVFYKYGQADSRAWTILIDPGVSSIFCTYMRNVDGVGEDYFEFYDANQFVPGRVKIITDSFEVIATYLNKYGAVNKRSVYEPRATETEETE